MAKEYEFTVVYTEEKGYIPKWRKIPKLKCLQWLYRWHTFITPSYFPCFGYIGTDCLSFSSEEDATQFINDVIDPVQYNKDQMEIVCPKKHTKETIKRIFP